ncbi:MAG: MCP four helix bundle domain-containing protein [Desulfosudis oleivorans]|nr:MCP four helix bundle domain-containing protein [Desulfosudis oleivorans]
MLFAVVAVMMLCARQYVSDQDSMYRQYVAAIRETGELKASIEKLDGYLYHYIAVPSARNNTMAILNQETNSIDQIVQNYKGKKLAPEGKEADIRFRHSLDRDAAGI